MMHIYLLVVKGNVIVVVDIDGVIKTKPSNGRHSLLQSRNK